MRCRTKALEMEFICWIGCNVDEVQDFIPEGKYMLDFLNHLHIVTPFGLHSLGLGDYIIKGANGEYSSCKPEVFMQLFEVLE